MQKDNAASEQPRTSTNTLHASAAVTELVGYKTRRWCYVAFAALTVLTGGVVLAILWMVKVSLPRAAVCMLKQCSLDKADYVLTKLVNGRQDLNKVRHIQMPRKSIIHEDFDKLDFGPDCNTARVFYLKLTLYIYDTAHGTFCPISSMPAGLPTQMLQARKALQAINAGADWSTLNAISSWPRQQRAALYGHNDMTAGRPNLFLMASQTLTYPLYLIQYVELAWTVYIRYYPYAGALFGITIVSGCLSTVELYRKRLQLFRAASHHHLVPVVQAGHVRPASSHRLVPGDVVVVLRGKATCDMVLLQGTCLVEESMLSGEAAQVRKTSFVGSEAVQGQSAVTYSPETHHSCTVHAGTYVQQVWNEDSYQEEVLAMVVRTGLYTTMGNMLRQVMAPANALDSLRDPFVGDVLRYCAAATILQLGIFMLYVSRASQHAHSLSSIIHHVGNFLVATVPTGIPTMLNFSLFRCVIKLRRHQIEVLQPSRIKTAAAVEVAVFDKTGTLTGGLPELHGFVPVVRGAVFGELQRSATGWQNGLRQCIAVCNSLNLVNKHHLAGESADYEAFRACEARFLERNLVALPLKRSHHKSSSMTTLTILQRFEFTPHLLRSGVLAADSSDKTNEAAYFARGAPTSIEELVGPSRTPPNYQQVIDDYSGRSFRVLALARGVLRGFDRGALMLMTQEQLETQVQSFELLGLLVLSNHLRSDSIETISALQQQAGLRTLMATGDYHHTALAVARGVGMIPPGGQVVIIQKESRVTPAGLVTKQVAADKAEPKGAMGADLQQQAAANQAAKPQMQTGLKRISIAEPKRAVGTDLQQQAAAHEASKPQMETGLKRSSTAQPKRAVGTDLQQQAAANGASKPQMEAGFKRSSTAQPKRAIGTDLQQQATTNEASKPQMQAGFKRSSTAVAAGKSQPNAAQKAHRGLTFHMENSALVQDDALQLLTAIAQGQAQCCVTGPALEHMLQLGDASLLETVMRNAVVFSRMKPHQKGQIMELLSSRGLFQGLGKTCMYCGDGINDLIALAAADVGIAIGAGDVSAAASMSFKRSSVADLTMVLRKTRAAQTIKLAAIRFMVLYQLLLSFMFNISFYLDGSQPNLRQRGILDLTALALGIVCSLRPASSQLIREQPPQFLCTAKDFIMLTATIFCSACICATCNGHMTKQSWYHGTGTSHKNPVVTMSWSLALFQVLIMPALTFQVDVQKFCKRISVAEISLTMGYLTVFTIICFLGAPPLDPLNYFQFYKYPWSFRWRDSFMGGSVVAVSLTLLTVLRLYLERHEVLMKRRRIVPT